MQFDAARPYAEAINLVATKPSQHKAWNAFLAALEVVVAQPEIMAMVQHPLVHDTTVVDVIVQALDTNDAAFKRLISVLVAYNRLDAVASIKQMVKAMFLRQVGRIDASVKSASPLTAALKKQIEAFILQQFSADGVDLECSTDPSLLGSIMIQADGKQINWSLQYQLDKIKANF